MEIKFGAEIVLSLNGLTAWQSHKAHWENSEALYIHLQTEFDAHCAHAGANGAEVF